ncbi:MAG TPA: enoyl-CoA hydratase-related protein, partial [Candidatus Elarobacter sp.]|nr:enoyl-CoA hydratase-related protein [Candidatus Elarobacter sp.]
MSEDEVGRYQAFDVSSADGIAHVVLKGPGKGNALGPDFWREGPDVFGSLDADASVRAIVLSGAGGNFTFGLDLHAMVPELGYALSKPGMAGERTRFFDQITRMQRALTSLMQCRKPVIAA